MTDDLLYFLMTIGIFIFAYLLYFSLGLPDVF